MEHMEYEQLAREWASNSRGHSDAAVAFAVLHLAEQVGRVADHLDRITDPSPGSPALRVDALQ